MGLTKIIRNVLPLCAALVGIGIVAGPTLAQKSAVAKPPTISRANLAQNASFTVTTVLSPKGGSKVTNTYRVEVKGNKARLDYEDAAIGSVRYVANEKGVFFVIPANKTAVRQAMKGGVDQALQVAFAQANEQLKTAKKIGSTNINGQPTDIYKDAQSGTLLYIGTKPGFRLPVKTLMTNEGGSRSITVTNIKTNITLPDAHFALPTGVQIIDGQQGGMPIPNRG